MRRLGIVAVALTLVLCIGIGAGCEAGPSSEMKDYAHEMGQWYDGFIITPERGDLELLASIDVPREMQLAHSLLYSTAASKVLADEDVRRLEERDMRLRQEGDDEVKACVNRAYFVLSFDLEMACDRQDAALNAYIQADINWAESMSEACGLSYPSVVSQAAMERCFGGE
jgi:hypothetical protein